MLLFSVDTESERHTHLCAGVRDEAADADGVSGRGQRRLPQALHERIDHGFRDLTPLLHLVKDLLKHTGVSAEECVCVCA